MPNIPRIESYADELTEIRRDFHAHPEIGFEEVRTSGIVADLLARWGIAVTRGLGKTGVVGVLEGRGPGRTIGLRADMDALPMDEQTNLPWTSKNAGVFHGCGHDSHTTMLLGAARYLAETRDFEGTVTFIFQPAEEGLGGARAMIADGLFEQFPCDEIYGIHNSPYHDPGIVGVKTGAAMAGAEFFDIDITGKGSHGAAPHMGRDPVVIGAGLVQELQTIVSRNVSATSAAVVSVTQIHGGNAYNVIPETVRLSGTVRYFDRAVKDQIVQRMQALCDGFAVAFESEIRLDVRNVFDVLVNDADRAASVAEVARGVVGADKVITGGDPVMGSEDMADMLAVVPGAYFTVGHKGDVPVHNPGFILDDEILPVGASMFARLVEARGAAA
ncbi:M20 aminoacylase family protein [Chachezhania antarctica]|uniref:M20 aminoacylase family protein n=1 Tax=Chachezhania antarctica TaxID=2340860 RepID=UPI000EB105DC|nr:M20 aminoacylase family protein [Chachezhania antarctica]|tara:strand:+ start:192 stop:1352 length:1161 start_codon:yes stop_codon:yes gene_type:complete